MARNSADVVDHDDAMVPRDDQDAQDAAALAAIHQSWLDESERTDVLEPRHLMSQLRPQSATAAEPPAPVPEPAESDEWEEAKTAYFERTANIELLDATFVNEYTERLQGELGDLVVRHPDELELRHPDAVDRHSDVDDREDPQWASLSEPSYATHESGPRRREDETNELDLKDISVETAPGGRRRNVASRTALRSTAAQRFAIVAPAPSQPMAAPSAWPAQRASVAPARGSVAPARGSVAPARGSVAPARGSVAPARGSVAPARASSPSWAPPRASVPPSAPAFRQSTPQAAHDTVPLRPIGARSSRPSHPAALPLAAEIDSDIAELTGRRRGRAATWVWLTASAACGAGLIFLIHSWNASQSPIVQAPPSAATETTVSAAQTDTGFSITSVPEGAQIFVDGKSTGFLTPANIKRLSPGLHSVELKLAGYYDTSLAAALQPNATLDMASVSLRRHAEGDATAAATPAPELPAVGAILPTKASPTKAHSSWRERWAARRAARHAVTRNAPVRALDDAADTDDDEEDTASAANGTGTLRINSRPWAAVMIDNKFVGNTPQRALRIKAGDHEVKLVNEPLNMSKRFHVKIREGETVTRVELLNDDSEESHASRPSGDEAYAQAD